MTKDDVADSLPGPHAWAWGTENIYFCQACYISFAHGTEPMPTTPCDPIWVDDAE